MDKRQIKGIWTYAPKSSAQLIKFVFEEKKILIAVNAEKILHSSDTLKNAINQHIGYPDGIGAVWALRKAGIKDTQKIPGCELWLDIIAQSYESKSFYLIGGTEDVIQQTAKTLKTKYPGIKILKHRNGYISSEKDREDIISEIACLKPDVVFVAMGSPKQELLMEEMYKEHKAVYQGLGGSFDVYTGNVKRAPKWWVKNNLEWAYRLVKQPSRIKRQIHLVRFFILLQFNKL